MNIYPPGYGPTFTCIHGRIFVTFEVPQFTMPAGDMEIPPLGPALVAPPMNINPPLGFPVQAQDLFAQHDQLGNLMDNWIPDLGLGFVAEASTSPPSLLSDESIFSSPSGSSVSSSPAPEHNTVSLGSTSSMTSTTSYPGSSSWPMPAPSATQNVALKPQARKRFHCPICSKPNSKRRDLTRHLWANHRDYAQKNNIESEDESCHVCGKTMRKDNLKRHVEMRHGL